MRSPEEKEKIVKDYMNGTGIKEIERKRKEAEKKKKAEEERKRKEAEKKKKAEEERKRKMLKSGKIAADSTKGGMI